MTINLKNFFKSGQKTSKMGDFQELKDIEGLQVSAVSADLYKNSRDDLSLFYFPEGSNYSVAYTQNSIVSESITWNKQNAKNNIKALVVNTKNANTFTGEQGLNGLDDIAKTLVESLKKLEKENGYEKTKIKDILFASTGVIGEKFPLEKIKTNIPHLVSNLRINKNKLIWLKVASAIMTTDTKPKVAYSEFKLGDKIIRIAGIAKGSGMIAPNLATMFSFIFTNADISSVVLNKYLGRVISNTFNATTVDSDTSTNDMVAIFATKKIKNKKLNTVSSKESLKFEKALRTVCLELSKQIVVDGEGATKFITVKIINSETTARAKNIAFSIANSPLVKTAVAGEDPNWGRILMGIGKSGEKIDPKKIIIKLGEFIVAENGKISESYNEEKLQEYMKWDSIIIEVDLKQGKEHFECYTCDFTHDYIDINAHYRRS
ncbi:MAG: bifunctional glutamate N-acetyltransferase/amino-acid acetyltransferase ArgJ [Pelagibacteraceae bacterium]|jgi:glutamate N-acetyltransferase / amino-acid N-acetyltransferase|nr:bifunctional glutamate N-acetyltransferase/amino-acid acetyltransferase ArgJ [Pelagibacteraceae bacterium]